MTPLRTLAAVSLSLLATTPLALQAASSALDAAFVTEISPGLTPTSYPIFAPGASVGAVNAVALQSDGKILAGGNVSRYKTSGDLTAFKRLLATGALDTSFNPGGAGLAAPPGQPEVNAILRVAGDKLYVGGAFSSYNSVARSCVLRLNADGSLDTAFDAAGLAGDTRYVLALVEQPDGKLLVAGGFTNINGTFRRHLARLNADGSLDTAFNPNTALVNATFVGDVAVLPNGQLVVAGGRTRAGGGNVPLLVRLNADGSLDSSLTPSFANDFGDIDELLVLPDGRMLIGGDFSFAPSGADHNFACLLPDGSLDTAFMANVGTGPDGWAGGEIALQPDGTLLVGGTFGAWNGQPRASIARVNQDGTLDPSFAPAPYATHGEGYLTHFYSFAVQPDGKFVAGGWLDHVTDPAVETYNLTRFVNEFSAGAAGTLRLLSATATTAENAGSITLQVSRFGGVSGAVSVQFATSTGGANGTASAGSDFATATGTLIWAAGEGGFKTITVTLPQDTAAESVETFTVTLSNPTGGAILPAANAKTVVTLRDDDSAPAITKQPASISLEQGASFTLSVGYDSVLPATIQWQRDPDGAGPLPYAAIPSATFTTYTVANAIPDTHAGLYRAVLTSTAGSTNSSPATIAVSVPAGSVDLTTFTSNVATPITKAIPLGDGRYLAITSSGLVRLNANGTVDATFSPVAPISFLNGASAGFPSDIVLQSDGKILVGGFFNALAANGFSTSRTGVARFNADGSVDTAFNLNLAHSVQSLALGAGGKLYVGGTSGGGFKRFTSAGVLDTTFSTDGIADNIGTHVVNGSVWAIQELADGRVLVSHTFSSSAQYRLQILSAAGVVDPTFNVPTMNWNVYGWDFLPDGRIAIAGRFTTIDGKSANRLALLHSDGSLGTTLQVGTGPAGPVIGVRYHQGRLLAWGDFATVNGSTPARLARFNLDGSFDPSFSVGAGANASVTSLHVTPTGDFDIFGGFTNIKGVARSYAARLVGNAHIGAIGFVAPRINTTESGLPLALTLRRYGPSTETVSINYATADAASGDTAVAGTDYTGATGTVTWAAGDSADKIVAIQLINDSSIELAKTFRVLLSDPSGPVSAAGSATVTLLDDDTPVAFTTQPAGPASALFAGGSLSITGTVVTSPTPVSYQWFLNGVAIPGATSATFAKNPVSLADAGLYTLVATNAAGAFPSGIIHVVVAPQAGRIAPGQATTLRPSFQSGGIQTLLALPDGGALIGGFFSANAGANVPQGNLIRVRADGSLDSSFTLNLGNTVSELLAQPDGKILIAGSFTFVNGVNQRFIYRLNADLTPDTAFNTATATAINNSWGQPSSIALDSTGRIYLGFNASSTGSVWRFSSAGVLDAAYTLSTSNGGVTALAMQSGDRLLVGGHFTSINLFGQPTVAKQRLARVDTEGVVDTTFTANIGAFSFAPISDLLVTPAGRIFVAGGTGGGGSNLIEVSATDGSTQTGGSSGNQIYEIAFGPDGRLALARAAVNGLNSVSRLNIPVGATTSADATFNVGTGPNSDVFALAYTADGSLWIAGTFSTFDGVTPSGGVIKLQGSAADPGIVNPPARADINAGGTAYFAVGAVGTNLTYQWLKNGAPLANDTRITGATTAILKITGLLPSDDDTYAVQVTGGTPSASVTSAPVKLNVLGAPVIAVNPPASLTPGLGSTVTLTADVLAAAPAVYVWKRGDTVLVNGGRYSGATTGTLVITGANASDNGAYTLTVTNSQGTASTSPATVGVTQNFTDRDASTGALGTSSGQVNDVVHLPDGRILVATNSSFTGANSTNVSANLVVVAADRSVSAPAAGAFNGAVNKLLRQSDGKILVAGAFTQIGAVARAHIARLNADLTLDTTFVPPAHTTGGNFNRLALDGQGRVYLGGFFSVYAGQAGLHYFVRLDGATGALDTSFVASSLGVSSEPTVIVSDSSGRLLIGGDFSTFDSTTSTTTFKPLIRLTAAGALDAGYAPALGGVGFYSYGVRALAFDDAGRLYVSAQFSGPDGFGPLLVRLLPAGTIDPAFAFASASLTQGAYALLPLASGKLLVGGNFSSPAPRLIRVNADGSLDNTFNLGTGFNTGSVTVFAPDASGRLWVGGSGFNTYQGVAANRLAVFQGEASALAITQQPSGLTRDLGASASFTVGATANNGFNYQWRKNGNPLSNGGRINGANTATLTITGLVASDSAAYSVVVSTSTASVTSASAGLVVLAEPIISKDPASATALFAGSASFSGAATGAATLGYQWLHGTTALVNGTVGGVTIAGATTPTLTITGATFAEAGEYHLRVTNTHGTATSAPAVLTVEKRPGVLAPGIGAPSAGGVRAILHLADGSMLVGGSFTSVKINGVSQSRNRLARFLPNGTLDPSFTPIIGGPVNAIAQDSAGRVFIGGDFTGSVTVGGVTANRTRVARLTSALVLDIDFNTATAGPNAYINTIAPTENGGVYVGGSFNFNAVGATSGISRLARLNAAGALDTAFTAPASINNEVKALLRRSDGKLYAGGTFGTQLLNSNGARDTAFNPDAPSILGVQGQSFLLLADGSLLLGANGALPQNYLRRLNANTGVTITDYNAGLTGPVTALAQQADGKLLAGGIASFKRFSSATGVADTGFGTFDSTISALAVDGSGRIWVGGSFLNYNGVSQSGLAVLAGGELDSRDGLLLPQTITFTDILDRTFGDNGNTQALAATSSASLTPITFSVTSSTPANIATISGNTLTITGAGSITVEAAQAGNATHRAATATQTFTVAKAVQTITFADPADRTTSSPDFALAATATPSGLPVSFAISSIPAGIATLSGNTVVLNDATGTVTLTASQSGNDNYNAASDVVHTFQVTAGTPQTITFNALPPRVTGATFILSATASSGLPVAFAITEGDASLGTDGKTVTVGSTVGTVKIRATQSGGTRNSVTYAPAEPVVQPFEVTAVPLKTQSITFNKPAARVFGSAPAIVVATSTSKLPVTITVVEGPGEIGSDGKLVLTGAGSIRLRATQPGNFAFFPAESKEQTLTVNKAPQTITFSVPTTPLALSTEPLVLAPLATPSGLPVSISLVSGPATLTGSTLRFTGTGVVKLRATQPGNANYLAAPIVDKTITVTSAAVLTISAPKVTYDGLDHPATVTGVPEGFADKLVVTYSGSLTLPRNAGSYAVVAALGTLKKTATLVINKADLAVSFEDRVRLVAEANPTVFETIYTGFKDDDTIADLATTTRPRGITKATIASNQGDYPITFTGGVDKNYRFVAGEPAYLTIVGYGGTYEALLVDAASTPVGKLTLAPSKNSLAYTGTINLARETASVVVASTSKSPGTSALVATEDFSSASATWTRTTVGKDTLALDFTVTRDGALTGSLKRNGEPFATLAGGRILYTPPAKTLIPWAGQHTLALHSAFVIFPVNEGPFPRGSGIATAVVSTVNGNLALSGKLADGTPLTATLKPWTTRTEAGALDRVGYVAWITPYGTRTESFLAGSLNLQPQPEPGRFPVGRRYIPSDEGLLVWKKAGNAKDLSYRTGFGPLSVSVSLDPWLPPVVAKPAVGAVPPVVAVTLPQRLGLVDNNTATAGIAISHGPDELDLGDRESALPFSATLAATAAPTIANALALNFTAPATNLTNWKLASLNPATGAFTGTFVLSDQVKPSPAKPAPRTVTFTGTLRQAPADEENVLVGTGFFLVPALPVPAGTPVPEQPSGELRFSVSPQAP